jgi:hypothetical protein
MVLGRQHIMMPPLLLPIPPHANLAGIAVADESHVLRVNDWIDHRILSAQLIFKNLGTATPKAVHPDVVDPIEAILHTATNRRFNHQSRGRLAALLPAYRQKLLSCLSQGMPIRCFFLYNGGYRASPLSRAEFIFEPDQTEWLLLYQIALLGKAISGVYPPGIQFSIVINNGVSHWVNDIPLTLTESYAHLLRQMIQWLGASNHVDVVLQSEFSGFTPTPNLQPTAAPIDFSAKDHLIVERFLGRACSPDEARRQHALYVEAEAQWARDFWPFVERQHGLLFRQIAHPNMLSFRPFPGGATRIQNGSLGFSLDHQGNLTPKLITSQTIPSGQVQAVPWSHPWTT